MAVKIKPKVKIELDYFEFGQLYASIKQENWNRFTRRLWLKLKIAATKAYLNHSRYGSLAKRDIKLWEEELNLLNKKEKHGNQKSK